MHEIYRLFRHYERPIANQRKRSVGAIAQSSEPEKCTRLILGRDFEIFAIYCSLPRYLIPKHPRGGFLSRL